MDDIPSKWSDWDLETIKDLVNHHAYEPGIFDFKALLVGSTPEGKGKLNESIAKTVCSMANSEGGYLIFGVADSKSQHSNPEDRIVGIPIGGEHRKEFAEKLKHIQPPVHFDAIPSPIPVDLGNLLGIFVVHVPLSVRRPHALREGDRWIFYRRGDGGSAESMDYYQVRDQMLFTEESLRQIALLRLKLAQFRQQCADLKGLDGRGLLEHKVRFETDGFDTLLATISPLLRSDFEMIISLLTIAPAAQALNRHLDLWHHDFGVAHQLRSMNEPHLSNWATQIRDEANAFQEVCGTIILRLRNEFGPLIAEPPNSG